MPDVVVIGGGIIGAATALELAVRGAAVTLLEKDELAAGASGRNLGYLDTSKDPALAPLARRSLERYLELTEDPPFPVFLDREPLGTLAVTIDEDERDDLRLWAASAQAVGVTVERVDACEVEPEIAPDVLEGYLLHEGHRVDPTALTVCLAALARAHGARIDHHRPARRL
ncbi:MAG TPA: FAD-dependent oxidoreductase, partial [Actinomycetota bacterium]|nr:FAD-dependent oxidoreductase [Actinomycetota bacterium]